MKALQHTKKGIAIAPGVIKDDADFTSNVIDTAGMSYIEIDAIIGSIDADAATLKLMESDIKTDANTLGGVPTEVKDATTKPGASDDNKIWTFGVDLVNKVHKRFMLLQAKAGDGAAGTYLAASYQADILAW